MSNSKSDEKKPKPGTFKPGNKLSIGNRGYTKAHRHTKQLISSILRHELEKKIKNKDGDVATYAARLCKRLVSIGVFGGDKEAVRAIAEIFDRTEGKATQRVEHAGDPDQPVQMVTRAMTPAEASRIVMGMLKKK